MSISYVKGDATRPQGEGNKLIVHICNDKGRWGRGFVMALSRRWREPERRYRKWAAGGEEIPFELGQVQFVQVEPAVQVANMVGQHDTIWLGDVPPIRYPAVKDALTRVAAEAIKSNASVHMPRIGCGLAGGEWKAIEQIVQETLIKPGIPVTVYDQ